MQFREAGASDAAGVAALHAESWRRHYRGAFSDSFLDGDVGADRLQVWTARLSQPDDACCTIVAMDGNDLVGVAHTILDDDPVLGALVDNLHVVFGLKRRGVGRQLMALTAEAVVARRPGSGLYLRVLEQNTAAQAFYEAIGGARVGREAVSPPGGIPDRLDGTPSAFVYSWPDPSGLVDCGRAGGTQDSTTATPEEATMFVQIIEGRTSNPRGLVEHGERWQTELRPGAAGYLGVTAGVTADGRTIAIVRFKDEASARANADRPEQTAWFEGMAKLYDGEPSFAESSDTTEWMGGGSDDAGFVQVMKSTGVDRSAVEAMDKAFENHTNLRPDVIGGLRVWTGPDSCVDVAYFTSEADARKGEKAEMPEELQKQMAEFGPGMGQIEYLDLTDPQLH